MYRVEDSVSVMVLQWQGCPGVAISHVDGICLNSSVTLDGAPVTEDGHVVHQDLIELATRLGKL